jgi:hypothetical protein
MSVLIQYLKDTLMEPVILWVADCLGVHYKGISVRIYSIEERTKGYRKSTEQTINQSI